MKRYILNFLFVSLNSQAGIMPFPCEPARCPTPVDKNKVQPPQSSNTQPSKSAQQSRAGLTGNAGPVKNVDRQVGPAPTVTTKNAPAIGFSPQKQNSSDMNLTCDCS